MVPPIPSALASPPTTIQRASLIDIANPPKDPHPLPRVQPYRRQTMMISTPTLCNVDVFNIRDHD